MDRLHAMTIFLAVIDEEGFAAAARKLKISPPVVTRAVTELEESLGIRLLTRTTRIVRVTEAGASYAIDCRRILADIAETEAAAAGSHATPRGHLVITAPVMFGQLYVMPIVTDYLRRYPETEVECRFLDRIVNLLEEGVDVAIRIGELPDSSYQAVNVGLMRQVVCASTAYIQEHGSPKKPEQLAEHAIISANGVTSTRDWRFLREGQPFTVRVRPRLSTITNDSAIAAALNGFGLTRAMSYMVAQHIAAGRLEAVLTEYEPAPVPVHVVHREGRHSTRKVRAFLDLAIDALRSDPAIEHGFQSSLRHSNSRTE
jgi:DNA-binding transcriptional LysR family regulator